MSLSIERFDEFFSAFNQDKLGRPINPFPWQTRLANEVFRDGWPDCIDLPTASGKTAAIDIAVFVLACQADRETAKRTVGRRIFFAVNRRVIVDEAFDRSHTLAEELLKALKADGGILKEVADALREISGDNDAPPLDVAQLRGGIYRDRAWTRSITQPIVVCTTADQLGSRLLFRGFGVSQSSRPIHAALCGCDSLVLLDEAHVTKAFCQTMQLLAKYQHVRAIPDASMPTMRFVQMTATPAGQVKRHFRLDDSDRANPTLNGRLNASKPAELVSVGKKSIVDEIVKRALQAAGDAPKAIGIIVNRVQTARDIHGKLLAKCGEDVHLVIGRMRPIDRDKLQEKLRTLVGPDRREFLDNPVFAVATQCLEVGADYDFDALITECASIDALRQRFGRLNRKGRPIEAVAAIIANDESLKGDDPVYGDAIKHTWDWLSSKKNEKGQVDFGVAEFKTLWDAHEEGKRPAMLAPSPDAAVLLPAHLDALCQTSPEPVPSPDASYFIHGPRRDMAEVNVCWRADLGDDPKLWPDIVRLLPPTSPECMTVPLVAVKRWMGQRFETDADADVPTATAEEVSEKRSERQSRKSAPVVAWRGSKDCEVVESATNIRPNDTLIIRTQDFGWESLGHIPGAPTLADWETPDKQANETNANARAEIERRRDGVDQAERATRQSRLRVAIRLHPVFPGRAGLRGQNAKQLRESLRALLETEFSDLQFELHDYPGQEDDSPEAEPNQVVLFKRLLEQNDKLQLPGVDEDDGDDDLTEGNAFIPLDTHTEHVTQRLAATLGKLHLNGLDSTVRASAPLHDIGKCDVRFQAMLAGVTPYEAMMLPKLLGKGDGLRRTRAEQNAIVDRAMYPAGFRHEMLSVELIEHLTLEAGLPHRDLLLHLIAAHHGYARPFAPICVDEATDDELRSLHVNGRRVTGGERKAWTPSHRLDSGVAERFWKLTHEHGWWGLAWLEAILRLADQQASAAEQQRSAKEVRDEWQ